MSCSAVAGVAKCADAQVRGQKSRNISLGRRDPRRVNNSSAFLLKSHAFLINSDAFLINSLVFL